MKKVLPWVFIASLTALLIDYRKGKGGRTLIDDIAAYNIGCEYGEYQNEH